jgi:hypothetical protein
MSQTARVRENQSYGGGRRVVAFDGDVGCHDSHLGKYPLRFRSGGGRRCRVGEDRFDVLR